MTIGNMHIAVKLELDKTSALELPAFESEEIDYWLNNAILKFVKTRYSGMNVKGTSFEQTQKRTDDLKTLVYHESIASGGAGLYENAFTFALPATYMFALQETCTIDVDGTVSVVGVTECRIDEYRQKRDDPYSEHLLHYGTAKPLRFFMNNAIDIVSDGNYDITYLHLTYLKEPATVDNVPAGTTDCDLPDYTHDEIVKLAVNMMLESIEQPRNQSYSAEVATME